ncbi:hypothetical protein F4819DRAFT_489503 [Hypoxylon fuscum]|nr:hypothetical protein F4819DRAFT_489503 [Hypoxylon fuscum]
MSSSISIDTGGKRLDCRSYHRHFNEEDIKRMMNMPQEQRILVANWYKRQGNPVWENILGLREISDLKRIPLDMASQNVTIEKPNTKESRNNPTRCAKKSDSKLWGADQGRGPFPLRSAMARCSRRLSNEVSSLLNDLQRLQAEHKKAATRPMLEIPPGDIDLVCRGTNIIIKELAFIYDNPKVEYLTNNKYDGSDRHSLKILVHHLTNYLSKIKRCMKAEAENTNRLEKVLRKRHKIHKYFLRHRLRSSKLVVCVGLSRGRLSPLQEMTSTEKVSELSFQEERKEGNQIEDGQ